MTHDLLRGAHVIAGTLALIAGLLALTVAKGAVRHRWAGRVFVAAGRIVVGSALVSTVWGLSATPSFVGDEFAALSEQDIDVLQLFIAMLGGLSLLAGNDLEIGLAGLRERPSPLGRVLPLLLIPCGAVLTLIGVRALTSSVGGLAWFAIVVGAIAIAEGWKGSTRHRGHSPATVDHFTGMIGALSAFLAAFGPFGAGRLIASFDLLDGSAAILGPVVVAIGGGQLVIRWWTNHWRGRISSTDAAQPPQPLSRP